MKKLLLFSGILFAFFAMQAQTILIQDNFDSYTVGDKLGVVNTAFTTWSVAPGTAEDGTISNEQAASPLNSLKVAPGNDIMLPLGNLTTGVYVIEFDYYVPSTGAGAYFNVLHLFAGNDSKWALECYFRNDGTGYLMAGTALAGDLAITYPSNQFFHVYLRINLTGDEVMLKINDVTIHTWPFHYEANALDGLNQLGAVNFYAGSPTTGVEGTYYVDNFKFRMDDAAVNENTNSFTIHPNPATSVLNISGADIIQVEMFNLVGQKVYTGNESSINVESFVSGTYFVKVITQTGTFTKKAIIK